MADRRCVMCPRSVYRQRRHILDENLPEREPDLATYVREHAMNQVEFDNVHSLCHRCWQQATSAIRPAPVPQAPVQRIQVEEYMRAPNRADCCIFNNCNNTSRCRIPKTVIIHMLCEHHLYIPGEARVCREHLESNNEWNVLMNHCNVSHEFNAEQFSDICNIFQEAVRRGTRFNFDTMTQLDDNDLHFWVGLSYDEFNIILNETPSLSERSNRPRTVLGIFLTKLRTGETDERLCTLFGMSRRSLERKLALARECLMAEFVCRHLGFNHLSRNDVISRNLLIPKGIFGDHNNTKAIVICDGTYIFIEKSSNFLFQRKSYSLHKFENLLKPFVVVCSDGYIIDVLGPYSASVSDAVIMQGLVNNVDSVWPWFFSENDVLILDRGFRDSVLSLEESGFEVHIPPSKYRNERQLTTEQANNSRLVTICRWVVEAVNGKIKQCFKQLRQTYVNRALTHMFDDFKIAAGILNAFHPVYENNRHAVDILNKINTNVHSTNRLYEYVEMKNLNQQRRTFIRIDANPPFLEEFPRLTEDDIVILALGTYQLKLAKSYVSEHINNGVYIIEICRDDALGDLSDCGILETNVWLLRARIQSRHIRARTYYTYILINRDQEGGNAISYNYCTCLTGRRTIGACAHVISLIWYLGLGRHEPFAGPARYLLDIPIDE